VLRKSTAAHTLVGPLDVATMRGPFGFDWESEIDRIEWVEPGKEIKDPDDRMGCSTASGSMKVDC